MRTPICLIVLLAVQLTVHADPELRGTSADLENYLRGIPKTVTVSGEAEVRVPAHRALLTLKVATENRSLQEALRANLELRGKLTEHLKKGGIAADRIQASKFSSTPKYGIFGDKAKSYRVENLMRVSVQDEKEFQDAAAAVDAWPEVQFGGVEFEYADKEALKARSISQACDNANEHIKVYETKFGMKLTPIRFSGGDVVTVDTNAANYGIASARAYSSAPVVAPPSSSPEIGVEGAVSTFGELVYTARISVDCTVQPASH